MITTSPAAVRPTGADREADVPATHTATHTAAIDTATDPATRTATDTATDTAEQFAQILASVLGVETVEPASHFFDDLGADSMVMARFCARVRKSGLPAVAMRDVYQAPTILALAAHVESNTARTSSPGPGHRPPVSATQLCPEPGAGTPAGPTEQQTRPTELAGGRNRQRGPVARGICGTVQMTWLVGYAALNLYVLLLGLQWVVQAVGLLEIYLRALGAGAGAFTAWAVLPIVLKWGLVGRCRAREFPVWGATYLRFWIVRTAIRANPLAIAFAGSPLLVLYLRALGARIGPGAVFLTRHLPSCPDLLTIGAGAIIREDAILTCYRARDGAIETGPVSLGREAFVGQFAVLDIDTSIGDRGQLGHASALHTGQVVPPGQSWHGTPAQPSPSTYRLEAPAVGRGRAAARRVGYSLWQLVVVVFIGLPLAFGLVEAALSHTRLAPLLHPELHLMGQRWIYAEAALAVAVWFYGGLALVLLVVLTVPRLLALPLRPGRMYPLYGLHYGLQRMVARLTNVRTFTELFGDASAIVGYLSALGYRLRPIEQSGSNFGQVVKHENPYLCTVGRGTVVADGLSLLNIEYGPTSFRLAPATIGAHNFLGNHIVYPAGGRTGDNVLLATKVAVPLDGPVRENVGLLGSPAFEIPRTVRRDADLALLTRSELRRRLRAKNRHNHVTMALFLAIRAVLLYLVILLMGFGLENYVVHGPGVLVVLTAVMLITTTAYWVLIERLYRRMQVLAPDGCSIYDHAFWRHERYWKGPGVRFQTFFDGTPLKPVLWRLLGVRVGRGIFDDGLTMPERGFVSIGDDCTFNTGSVVQCHSQEDGAFKSDRTSLGSRCTVGVGSLVHYGVTIGDDVQINADSFVMKGEEVPADTRWAGNPARPEATDPVPASHSRVRGDLR